MSDVESWALRAAVLAVVGGIVGLFARLRRLEAEHGVVANEVTAIENRGSKFADEQIQGLRHEISDLRLHIAEGYVRRDDYIRNQSQMIGLLESHSVMLARLEERIGGRT